MILIKVFLHITCFIKKIFYKLIFMHKIVFGYHVMFRKRFNLFIENGFLNIGNRVFFNNDCSINCRKQIIIGDDTIFGENVKIYDHNHKFGFMFIDKKNFTEDCVKIGKNCWICSNVIILKGAEIGDNSVIGAGCVVNTKIPPNSIVTLKNNILNVEELKNE